MSLRSLRPRRVRLDSRVSRIRRAASVACECLERRWLFAENLVVNPGFESPVINEPYVMYETGATWPQWTVGSGTVDLIRQYWQPAQGAQSVDLSGAGPGSLRQDFWTTPGFTYTLRFALAGNPDGGDPIKDVQVTFGNDVRTFSFDTTGRTRTNMGWTYIEYPVVATNPVTSPMRLTFQSLEHSIWGPAIDDVSVVRNGLTAIYHDNADFTGNTLHRQEKTVDVDWGAGSPDPFIAPDTFTSEWYGQIEAKYDEEYVFHVLADDYVRLWINDKIVRDLWNFNLFVGRETATAPISLAAGQRYNIRVEHRENHQNAKVKVSWSSPSQIKEVIPAAQLFIEDNRQAPPTPTLSASMPDTSGVRLAYSSHPESYTSIFRSTSTGGPFTEITNTTSVDPFIDNGVAPNTTYYYRVRTGGPRGRSAFSNTVTATTPDAPSGAIIDIGPQNRFNGLGTVRLMWLDNSTRETNYIIERSGDGATWSEYQAVPPDQTLWDEPEQMAFFTYPWYYRVRARYADDTRSIPTAVIKGEWPIEKAVRLTATVTRSPQPRVTLSWDDHPHSEIWYKRKEDSEFTLLGRSVGSSFVHDNVTPGQVYEYKVRTAVIAAGVAVGDIESQPGAVAPYENRGAVLLVIDQTLADDLVLELDRLEQDLTGDGWRVLRTQVPRNDDANDQARYAQVLQVKQRIKDLRAVNTDLRTVFLIGHVPLALTEPTSPDGHAAMRPVATDAYYGDVVGDGAWTDANQNALLDFPGQSLALASEVELEVGRVDLAGMSQQRRRYYEDTGAIVHIPGVPFADELTLLKRYFDRHHRFRIGEMVAQRRAMTHDNWGNWPAGAYAVDAWQGLSALVGAGKVQPKRWYETLHTAPPPGATDDQTYLWAHATGPGAAPDWLPHIAVSDDYANRGSSAIFQEIFGSYLWEWHAPASLLRSVIAGDGHGLAAIWGNFPDWRHHHMSVGEDIGYGIRLTQNNSSGEYPWTGIDSERTIVGALMGDPTLRLHVVAPPRAPTAQRAPTGGVMISWQTSLDPEVVGYTVYRSNGSGPWQRISGNQYVRGAPNFSDPAGQYGLSKYMIRAIKPEEKGPDGTPKYYNASQGVFVTTASAEWVWMHDTGDGTWQDMVGNDDAYIAGDAKGPLPWYVQSVSVGAAETTWAASTSEPRALQKESNPNDRVAAAFESSTSFTMDVRFNDADTHRLTLYFLDWQRLGRNQRIEILDPIDNSTILDLGTIGGFQDGLYLGFNVSGSVRFRFTGLTPNASAVLSGIFFDPA